MDETLKPFSLGIWLIKSGKENEFIDLFQKFADWVFSQNLGAIEVYLLQDVQEPRRFITCGPWETIQKMDEWRKLQEFKEFFADAKEISDEITPLTMKPIMHAKR
jgi:quinol monooxygenase YgiN